jgi:hypothetical protein
MATCKICEKRRPRRRCPGVGGEICAVCCGTERENTVSCLLDCEYLREAREHEKRQELDPEKMPNRDIRVTEEFLERHAALVAAMIRGVVTAGLGVTGAVDQDVRDALESMVQTYRTRQSGLYYESRPQNLLAARIQELIESGLAEYRKASAERLGMETVRDADVLGTLVFLERVGLQFDNGRRRGRAFLDFLRGHAAVDESGAGASPLVLP